MGFCMSPGQAWAVLDRHAKEEIEPLRLQELMRDDDRVSSLVAVYNTSFEPSTTLSGSDNEDSNPRSFENRVIIVDLSRQRMTVETINHLLKLAAAKGLRQFILQLAWGQNNRKSPIHGQNFNNQRSLRQTSINVHAKTIPSMHMALRAPRGGAMLLADGSNALIDIHREWDRMERLSDSIRRGQLRGVTGSMIRDVILIGRGTPIAALQFVYAALLKDERANLATRFGLEEPTAARIRRNLTGIFASTLPTGRTLRFLSTIDPLAAAQVVTHLDPASTLVISLALNGNEETGLATKVIKTWLLQSLGSNRRADQILSKHMLLVTGNQRIASVINKPERVHLVPEHSKCEPFTTFSPAGLLPLSIVFGWDLINEFLQGAHDMDKHFVETNPRHNAPVLLALADTWNDVLLGASARMIMPFSEALACYPKFVSALESQTCCRSSEQDVERPFCSSIIVDAGLDGLTDRSHYQGSTRMNLEIITALDSQFSFNTGRVFGLRSREDMYAVQDSLMCSLFAHADELALGSKLCSSVDREGVGGSPGTNPIPLAGENTDGNRSSLLLITGKLDAFTCGQLIALAEHRVVVKAFLHGLDPFVREPGSAIRRDRIDIMKEELQQLYLFDDDEEVDDDTSAAGAAKRLNLSSQTLLQHYADVMRNQRNV